MHKKNAPGLSNGKRIVVHCCENCAILFLFECVNIVVMGFPVTVCHYHSEGKGAEGQGTGSADRSLTHHELCRIQLRLGTYTSVMDISVRRGGHVMCAPNMPHSQDGSPRLVLWPIRLE